MTNIAQDPDIGALNEVEALKKVLSDTSEFELGARKQLEFHGLGQTKLTANQRGSGSQKYYELSLICVDMEDFDGVTFSLCKENGDAISQSTLANGRCNLYFSVPEGTKGYFSIG